MMGVYETKDFNIKFLRSLPKEWKPIIVRIMQSHNYVEYTFEKLYTILKTYELKVYQDEEIET